MKEETFRQKQAFEIYYGLGDGRTLEKLRETLRNTPEYAQHTPALDTLKSWSRKFNWQLRIQQRDIENAKSLEKKTDKSVVDEKVEIRKIIQTNFNILKQSINDYIQQNRIAELKTISDFNQLSNILDRLARLEMDLVGESMLKAEVDLTSESLQKILLTDTNLKEKLLEALEKAKNG